MFLASFITAHAADDVFTIDFNLDSRHSVDSSRKNYSEEIYNPASITTTFEDREYDQSFISTTNDMFLALRGDLNETQYLDIKENLYFQYYDPQDTESRSVNSLKYKNLDHQLNMTFGTAVGDHDYFQLDYFNNVNMYDTPSVSEWTMTANKGEAFFTHEFAERTCLVVGATVEERSYENDEDSDYREGAAKIELITFIPGRYDYRAISNSTRGDINYFKKTPTGMDATKAVKYYTDWQKNPRDDNPAARYQATKMRGDSYLAFNANFINRDRIRISNSYNHTEIGFHGAYEIAQDICVRLNESYSSRDYNNESNQYFLHDFTSNYFSLSSNYDYSKNISQSLTFINEFYDFKNSADENYKKNTLQYNGYYSLGQSLASLVLATSKNDYEQSREYYPDSNENRLGISYDYPITSNIIFRFKDDWINTDYGANENSLYSSHTRSTWRVAVEKKLSESQLLELGYQENSEKHDNFMQNNVDEKSLAFSWLMHY